MSWTAPEGDDKFRVKVFMVDNTYWDDGNRTTSRNHDFVKLADAYEFLTSSRKKRWYETTSYETGEKLRRCLSPDDFRLYRYDGQWKSIADDEILTLLAML